MSSHRKSVVAITSYSSRLELLLVLLGFAVLTVGLTYPLAFRLGSIGYKIHAVGDAQYSVWNVAWVAHSLLSDPRRVFDANIFYPHPSTLVYSEANLVAGALGVPVYLLSGGNPYATHNFVVLLSFVLSATGMYYLTRHLVGDRFAAGVAAICFAYSPYALSHLANIQLLMTAGIPFSLLAFHRLTDRPTPARGVTLGLAMGLQALACAYYGVFLTVLIGPVVVIWAGLRGLWGNWRYWVALCIGGIVAAAIVWPLFALYLQLQAETGFHRPLDEARRYSATWGTYLVAAAYASSWLRDASNAPDVLFPGLVATIGGVVGFVVALFAGGRQRQIAALYGALGAFSLWESLGPAAGLYTFTYAAHPAFGFIHAPSRFGLIPCLALSVLASIAVAALSRRSSRPAIAMAVIIVVAVAEHASPFQFTDVPAVEPAYRYLAKQPVGAIIELPLYSRPHGYSRTKYMLGSTVHWMPMVSGYSDHTPADFSARLSALAGFPSAAAFRNLPVGVRYAVFHLDGYRGSARERLLASLASFSSNLQRIYADDDVWLYEILSYPTDVDFATSVAPHKGWVELVKEFSE